MYCDGNGNVEPTGECDQGYFCTGRSSTARPAEFDKDGKYPGAICPISNFCPSGSPLPTECAAGMFCGKEGLGKCYQDF